MRVLWEEMRRQVFAHHPHRVCDAERHVAAAIDEMLDHALPASRSVLQVVRQSRGMAEEVPHSDPGAVVDSARHMDLVDELRRQVGRYALVEVELSALVQLQDGGGRVKLVDACDEVRGVGAHRRAVGTSRPRSTGPADGTIHRLDGQDRVVKLLLYSKLYLIQLFPY